MSNGRGGGAVAIPRNIPLIDTASRPLTRLARSPLRTRIGVVELPILCQKGFASLTSEVPANARLMIFAMKALFRPLGTLLFGLTVGSLFFGCRPIKPAALNVPAAPAVADEALRDRLDAVLNHTLEARPLNLKDHAAWQIIHGALCFGKSFPVLNDDKIVSALDYALAGGEMKGWIMARGDLLDAEKQRYGVRSLMAETADGGGQGHVDQWLGYLADIGMKLDQKIVVEGHEQTLADFVEQVERDVHRNPKREYSWTLMALTAYRPTNHKWIAGDGNEWSIEKLLEIELEHEIDDSPCGGSHRLVGLTMARNRHLAAGGKLEGVWKQVDDAIRFNWDRAKQSANPDGSLSCNYFVRPGTNADMNDWLSSAGHVLEFVVLAADEEQLKEPWVTQAVGKMTTMFETMKTVPIECGALYHAAHGLLVYRQRIYGAREYRLPGQEVAANAAELNQRTAAE